MATMVNLRDLLEHEIEDLYSAEEQIIEALPKMAQSATNRELKKTLNEHLRITKQQKKRLDQIKKIFKKLGSEEQNDGGFLGRMFGDGGTKCKGTEGLIKEGEKMMSEDMEPAVKDAAIIASCQKIEHYEISGYGTARAYAKELRLREVEQLLAQTLKEEYTADKLLNVLALKKVNIKAEGNHLLAAIETMVEAQRCCKKIRSKERWFKKITGCNLLCLIGYEFKNLPYTKRPC